MKKREVVRVGTRDSKLALWQTNHIINVLSQHRNLSFKVVTIKSMGDQVSEIPFEKLEGKGFFTKELDQALLTNTIDIAVHSLKDIPTELPNKLKISAVTKRHEPRDVLIARHKLSELPQKATLATGSLRRKSQLLVYRPDFNVVGLRGNLQTRYKKFKDSNWDGIVLAGAGMDRLEMSNKISERIHPNLMVPAVGQGSLGVVSRKNDHEMKLLLKHIEDKEARIASSAERSFLSFLGGGCTTPIACYCKVNNGDIHLDAFVGDFTGKKYLRKKIMAQSNKSIATGKKLAEQMIQLGADQILNRTVS